MNTQVGIWIDLGEAVLVALNGERVAVERVGSQIRRKHRSTGGVRSKLHFWHRSVISARKEETRRDHEIVDFCRAVHERIQRVDGPIGKLFLFGPGEAKTDLSQFLLDHGWPKSRLDPPETIDNRISERQIVAAVKAHFGRSSPRKSLRRAGAPVRET